MSKNNAVYIATRFGWTDDILMGNPGESLAQLAEQFGYQSEAAFSRAFKRVFGVPPGRLRRST